MSITSEDLQQFERIMGVQSARVMRFVFESIQSSQENILSTIDEITAAVAAQVVALTNEVANANAKTDAALSALAASIASNAPVTQAQLDAITAIGTDAVAATAALKAEEEKVNSDLAPTTSVAPTDEIVKVPTTPTDGPATVA